MESKIIQIIPAPTDMWVRTADDGDVLHTRVVCLALVQHEDGTRDVALMDVTDGDGVIDLVNRFANIVYSPIRSYEDSNEKMRFHCKESCGRTDFFTLQADRR